MDKPLILVVEDDRAVRSLVTTTLDTHDYKYITAQNGQQALLEIVSRRPNIILLDLGLPDMDGIEIIKKVRSWSIVPIIVISARSEDKSKIEALDTGADDYLTKPFSIDELLARLRATMRRLKYLEHQEIEDVVFTNGDLKVNFDSGCAYLNDQELHLTPIEYKLLCLLAKNIDKVLNKKGIVLLHYISGRQEHDGDPWIKKYIFPGGIIPSLREIIYLIGEYNYYTLDVESLRRHYEKTLLEWSKNYAAKRDVIDTMFEERFVRMWELYLVSCASVFHNGICDIHQILFTKGVDNDLPMTRNYLYED